MPKKTKKQKLRADRLRKKTILQKSTFIKPVIEEKAMPAKAPPEPSSKKIEPVDEYSLQLVRFTMNDLRKTVIITLFLFTLEFAIFYAKLRGIELESLKNLF